jgi:hypothetical protein
LLVTVSVCAEVICRTAAFAPAGIVMEFAAAVVLTVIVKLLQMVTSSPEPGTLAPVVPVQLVADHVEVALQLPVARPKRVAASTGETSAQMRVAKTSRIAARSRGRGNILRGCMQTKSFVIRL